MTEPESRLSRRLGTGDAVVLGLGAMIGTGVFVVWQPAAERAANWLLAGLAVAAFVAFCNATSSAQLAAVHPQAGGTYVYGRARLGAGWGALAGYAFVFGKIASCAAAAHAVGTYLWPDHSRIVAVAAAVLVTATNLAGVQRTARATRWLVTVVAAVLVAVVAAGLTGADSAERQPLAVEVGINDVLGAAALLFFAFAGYARIATLGEEVRDPARTIPRAVPLALALVLLLYLAVGGTVLLVLGPGGAAEAARPITAVVDKIGAGWLVPVATGAAAIAALAALLALVAGISRTAFAMAAEADLPGPLAAVHPTRRIPHVAEIVVGIAVVGAVLAGGLVGALSFSAFAVLLYYAVTNAAALRLRSAERRWPRWLAVAGLVSCLLLAASLPWQTIALGVATLAVAMIGRAVSRRFRQPAAEPQPRSDGD
ncbi:MAG TPA: APC family permease [Jiangellaceae bacterium]|nr:APC family permease [Jiangellaceae bacterium]